MDKIRKHIQRYQELFFELIRRDIKVKYRGSLLGVMWSMLNPLLTMIVLVIVFSDLFKHKIAYFPVYVLTGRILFQYFSDSTKGALTSITGNASLLKKIYIPRYLMTVSEISAQFMMFLVALIPLFSMMLLLEPGLAWCNIAIIYPLLILFVMSIGVGLFLASVTVFFRDVEHFYGVLLMIIMYMSAIFYPISIVPHRYLFLMKLNPLYYPIKAVRSVLIDQQWLTLETMMTMALLALFYLVVGSVTFNRLKNQFIHHI